MKLTGFLAAGALAAFLAAPAAMAQTMPGMPQAPAAGTPTNPADAAYRDAMAKMHAAMDVPLSGNADHDFAAMMIGHHQGAIDMAETELKYGKDAQMRALAKRVIATQRQEISEMRRWQARQGQKQAR